MYIFTASNVYAHVKSKNYIHLVFEILIFRFFYEIKKCDIF